MDGSGGAAAVGSAAAAAGRYNNVCSACGEKSDRLKRCTACKLVWYCNVECQRAHRREHREECKIREACLNSNSNPPGQISWRDESIKKFSLQPVPEAWTNSVAVGSEEAWKKYYERRIREEKAHQKYETDEDEDDCWGDEDGSKEFMKEWKSELDHSFGLNKPYAWHWTPKFGYLTWEDDVELRSAEYYGYVWSPFAIPHAIELKHRYHRRPRRFTMEFCTVWSYRLIDFEDKEATKAKYRKLCSNYFEDEELRADVIETEHLNKNTVDKLRRFLFGSSSEESKKLICPDFDFLKLLFASMGTTDLEEDMKEGWLGYCWSPSYDLRKKLFKERAPEDDCLDGDPPESFDDYYPKGCSWLQHRVMEITDSLGPVSKYYRPPTIKDAPGYRSPDEGDY